VIKDLSLILELKAEKHNDIEEIDLRARINSALALHGDLVAEIDPKIFIDFQVERIQGIGSLVDSILYNLIGNSLKFREPGRDLIIRLNSYREGSYIVLRCEDNGIGIDLSKHGDKLFGLYKRFETKIDGKGGALMDEASSWLAQRDALLEEMQAVGLSAPDRLQQAYRSYGGGPEAVAELEAEEAVVDVYASTAAEVNSERTFLERIGLIGGQDPADQLSVANGRFADGDLRGALESISEAQRMAASAETGGIVRIASAAIVALLVLVLAVLLVRRRATYTGGR
jgi:hypothetical protein